MAVEPGIAYRNISIHAESLDNDLLPLVYELRPEWKKDDIRSVKLSGGFVNTLQLYHLASDMDKSDAIVARVHNQSVEGSVISREREFVALQAAIKAGCFPAIYIAFMNGFLYPYTRGRMMTMQDFSMIDIVRQTTTLLCCFHEVDLDLLHIVDTQGKTVNYVKNKQTLMTSLADIPDKSDNPQVDVEFQKYRQELTDVVLKSEICFMEDILNGLSIPLAMNHGDFYMGNLLIDEVSSKVTILDYEMAGWNYRSRDLALFFIWKPYTDIFGATSRDVPDLSTDTRSLWLRCYLEAKYHCMGKTAKDIPDFEYELFDIEHRILETYGHLWMLLYSLCMVNTELSEIRPASIVHARRMYFSQRKAILDLKKTYVDIKSKTSTSRA